VQNQLYVERLYPSKGLIAAYLLSFPMVLLAAAPFGWSLALILASVITAGVLVAATLLSPLIVVDQTRLMAGQIAIPLSALGAAKVLRDEELRMELGPNLNARAQKVIKGEVRSALKIAVTDEKDPTPYLVISTRNPEELASALLADRT
jgi:hypothetical protein